MRLHHKIAVVTGASGGIGQAICQRFAAEGARVAALDLHPSPDLHSSKGAPKSEIATLNASPNNASPMSESSSSPLFIACDLSNQSHIAQAAQQVQQQLGNPDIVVHAAAVPDFADTLTADGEDFHRVMEINVFSAMRLVQYFAPAMQKKQQGSFIFISSITGVVGAPGMASYSASKGAINTLTRTMALELAERGIRVNNICPASIDTPMLRASFELKPDPEAARKQNIRRHPLGRLGTPEDVANLALFLSSDEASWITGTTSIIDGGAHINRR